MTRQDDPNRGARRIDQHPILGPAPAGEQVQITLDQRTVLARSGEPVAAALLAAGVRAFRTMPVSGEARSPFCLVGRCTDCLVHIDGVPNVRACVTPVRAGMRIQTQHGLGVTVGDES